MKLKFAHRAFVTHTETLTSGEGSGRTFRTNQMIMTQALAAIDGGEVDKYVVLLVRPEGSIRITFEGGQ